MAQDKKKALKAAGTEAAIELVKVIPLTGVLIESVRKYRESMDEQQREQFVHELLDRMQGVEANSGWYKTDQGEEFVKKVMATALNAEYADKLSYLANALINGPSLGDDQARRLKFVEMIRQLSRPALEVLAASLTHRVDSGQVMPEKLAKAMKWHPALVSSCVQELHAIGAYSSVTQWQERGGEYIASLSFRQGTPAITEITDGLARFISLNKGTVANGSGEA